MSALARILPARPPAVRSCRRCGCTDQEACIVAFDGNGQVAGTCGWVDEDLCSRCHRPGELTARQRHEAARIADRWGPVEITAAFTPGHVNVRLVMWEAFRWTEGTRYREPVKLSAGAPCVVLDLLGRPVRVESPVHRVIA